jgi:ribosome assembly protein YihI (activator of Der GTPase)
MKTEEDDLLVYDEDEAVKFILNHLPAAQKANIPDTKVEYILDVIYDFYDEKGLIEEDTTEEASIDEEEMFKFLKKCAKKDKMAITDEEIQMILEAEYEYGKSIGIYN